MAKTKFATLEYSISGEKQIQQDEGGENYVSKPSSVPLEVCDPSGSKGCLKCGHAHMGKQFASKTTNLKTQNQGHRVQFDVKHVFLNFQRRVGNLVFPVKRNKVWNASIHRRWWVSCFVWKKREF